MSKCAGKAIYSGGGALTTVMLPYKHLFIPMDQSHPWSDKFLFAMSDC